MTDNPLIDTVNDGTTTYDIVGKKVKNTNTATGAVANLSVWRGTLQQYNDLLTHEDGTVYSITDGATYQTKIIFRRYS